MGVVEVSDGRGKRAARPTSRYLEIRRCGASAGRRIVTTRPPARMNHLLKLPAASGSQQAIDLVAVGKHHEAGDAIDVELRRQLRLARHIDAADRVARLLQALDRRHHLLARSARRRGKIQENGFAAAGR